jgi:hypothetical protein
MKKIRRRDILDLAEYEKIRNDARKRVIDIKKIRRVALGELVTLVFENRDTVLSQIQEMIRAEHIEDDRKILHEIETYNELIPDAGELSATLFIEMADPSRIQREMDRFQGIDSGEALYLRLGHPKIFGRFETGRSNEKKLSAVHYIRFPLFSTGSSRVGVAEVKRLFDQGEVELVLFHPGYQSSAVLSPELKAELIRDLE